VDPVGSQSEPRHTGSPASRGSLDVGRLPVQPQVALRGPDQLRPGARGLLEFGRCECCAVDDDCGWAQRTELLEFLELGPADRVVSLALG